MTDNVVAKTINHNAAGTGKFFFNGNSTFCKVTRHRRLQQKRHFYSLYQNQLQNKMAKSTRNDSFKLFLQIKSNSNNAKIFQYCLVFLVMEMKLLIKYLPFSFHYQN